MMPISRSQPDRQAQDLSNAFLRAIRARALRLRQSVGAGAVLLAAGMALPAAAQDEGSARAPDREVEFNFYGGWSETWGGRAQGSFGSVPGSFDAPISWDGGAASVPGHFGLRATWWRGGGWGFGVEYSHDSLRPDAADVAAAGFDRLDMADGLNILTLNASRRWSEAWGTATPYLSAGLGIAVPEIAARPAGGTETFGTQLTGPAARLTAGISYPLGAQWSLFSEYQFTASDNSADLAGGGTLESTIYTNAVNLGVGFRF